MVLRDEDAALLKRIEAADRGGSLDFAWRRKWLIDNLKIAF